MKRSIAIISLLLLAAGCSHDSPQPQAQLYEKESIKPVVALVPLFDHAKHLLSWSLSEELTSLVHYGLMQRDKFYLVDDDKVATMMKRLKEHHNPFDTDLSWMKRVFFGNEFVVFMELIDHAQTPLPAKEEVSVQDLSSELTMRVRIRVVDLREEEPKVTLQEIIADSHQIPKEFNSHHFTQVEWGQENYTISPMGMAHANLSREIATRLEDYILYSMEKRAE